MNKFIVCLLFCSACSLGFAREIFATYEAKPLASAKLAFAAPGIIKELGARVGDSVQKGDKLAVLDDAIERAKLRAANARAKLTAQNLARVKAAQNALSQSVLDEARSNYEMAAAELALAQALLAQKTLKAPFSGQISAKFAERGDGVAGPVQPIYALEDTSAIELEIAFNLDDLADVKVGDRFEFVLNGSAKSAQIRAISPSASGADRKMRARAIFHGAELVAGSYGEGKIISGK